MLAKVEIQRYVQPSYGRLHKFMEEEYLAHTRPHIAASSLPGGEEYYAACLHFHTTTNLSAKQINAKGRDEVARITKRMTKVMKSTGFKGDLKAFKSFLRTDPRFNYSSGQEIIDNFRNKGAHAHSLLPKFFSIVPKAKYIIVPVPDEIAPSMSGAYYLAPPADGSRPGTFYINTYKPEQRKRYSATSTGLHEAEPGHHLQGALAIENGSKITYRRFMEDRKYYEAPASYPKNTAYVEGWGLYAEYLGEEMGVYGDPYDMFGRLSDEMLRATRLVVDTGMHALGMSKKEAIAYMFKYTALSEGDIESEVNRYITWPGQACGYKMGEIKIRELREKAAGKLGAKFNLREFNTMVASVGGMPLNFLEEQVDEWIKKYL